MDEQLKKLFDALSSNGYYTKSFEDFKVQFADSAYQDKVFGVVSKEGLFTKSKDDFINKYTSKKKEDTSRADTDLELESGSSELPKIKVPEVKTGTTAETDVIDPEDEVYNKAGRGEDFINFFSSNIDAGLAQGNSTSEVFDIMKSGSKFTDQEIDALIDSAKEMDELPPSEEMIKFTKAVEDNGGDNFAFLKTLADFDDDVNSYKVLAETGIRSLAGMIKSASEEKGVVLAAGGVGLMGGPATSIVGAMSAAGGLMETSVSFIEFLKEELGGKEFTRENISDILNDEEKRKSIRNRALIRGGTTALFDLIGGALATKTAGAVAKVAKKTTTGLGKTLGTAGAVGTAGVVEGVFGGAGEATARLAAGQEYSAIETGLETFGGSAKGIITGPLGIVKTSLENTPYYKNLSKGIASYELNGKIVNKKDIEEFIDSSTPEEVDMFLRKTELVINNDSELSNKIENKRKRFKVSKDVVSDPNGKNTEKIIDLEVELDGLKNKKTESSNNRRNQIKEEIKNLQTEESPIEDVNTDAGSQDQLQLLNEDNTTFEKPDGSELYIIGKTQRTVALVDSSGKLLGAFDAKTGKKRKTTASSESELIKQVDYNKGKSAFDGVEAQERETTNDEIASSSENPKEVAVAFMEEKNKSQAEKAKSQKLFKLREDGDRFTLNSLIDLFVKTQKEDGGQKTIPAKEMDKFQLKEAENQLKKNFPDAFKWVAKNDQGINIEDLSDYNEVWELIKRNPPTATKKSVTETNLKERFKELTGLTGTDSQIQMVAEQDPSQLMSAREPIEVTQEQAAKQEELQVEEKVERAEEQAKQEREAAVEPKTEGIIGRISDALKKTKDFLKKQATIHFTAQGLQPDIIYKERQKRDSQIRKYQNRIDRMRKDINSVLKKIPKDQRDSVMKELDQVFRGQLDPNKSNLSIDLLAIAGRMRSEIDGLSNMIIESGYFDTKDGLEAVEKNIGSYVNRSYRIFSDSNWPNKVSEEVKENARRFFRRQAIQEGRSVSEQEIEAQINEILNKAEDNKYIVKGKDGRIDKDILRRRKDVPAELRALMGEVTNPLENYLNTVSKQAMLLFNYKFQRKIAESGSNTFFTKTPTKENTVQIVKEGNEAYPELAGLWTTPEIAKTFEMPNPMSGHWDAFVKFSSAIKWGKTVGSIVTHAKNILGNHGFVLMNGHLDWNEFTNAADLAIKEFRGKTTEEQRAYLDELISLGIVKQSATLGDITTMYGDSSFEQAYKRTIIDQARNVASKKQKISDTFRASRAGKMTKDVVDSLNDLYQSEDDFFKIMAYGIEKQRYAKALFGKDKADLTKSESDEVNEVVSEIVKNTYPTYDRVPPIIKRLGRSPFLGAFVSFRAESIRTAYNTYKIALNEVNSKNKEISKIGAKRLASAGLYTGLKIALATQLGLAAKSLIHGGEDDESEEYNDLRRFVATWSQESLIGITSKEPGKYTFIDLTANDPHSFLSELIIAGRDNKESTPLLVDKLAALGEPFLGKDLVFSFVSDSYLISEDQKLSSNEKVDKIMSEFFKLIQPGTITSAIRLKESALGGKNKFENEIAGFTGYRPVELDVEKSYLFRVIDFKDKKSTIMKTYNRTRYNKESTKEDLSEAYNKVNEDYSQIIKEVQELTKSALRLGVGYDAITKILSGKFNKRDKDFIFSGKDYFYIPNEMRK